jgi:hypothetical protein
MVIDDRNQREQDKRIRILNGADPVDEELRELSAKFRQLLADPASAVDRPPAGPAG